MLWETPPSDADQSIERVVLCSGKVYYDLLQAREEQGLDGKVALIRLEQLAPFPEEVLDRRAQTLPQECQVHLVPGGAAQHGAAGSSWRRGSRTSWRRSASRSARLIYAGRKPSASPATGSHAQHEREQRELVADALTA